MRNKELDRPTSLFGEGFGRGRSSELVRSGSEYFESIGLSWSQANLHILRDDYPEVYLSLATIVAEDGLMEEAFAYLEESLREFGMLSLAGLLVR